ncbi:hypothetical protein HXY32_04130 [Candidatus Bathyarchaeota archaeon]|nr:hypothetical protein [Candidatus Bathyarchaeota archaeon]
MHSFKEAVLKAIGEYNHYRSPEATVKLIEIGKDKLVMDFEGSFCKTCGAYDYLEDFIYELQRFIEVEMEILRFENYAPEKIRVEYVVKHKTNQR